MLETQTCNTIHITSRIVESVYAKIQIGGSNITPKIYEVAKIDLERGPDKNGWWLVQPANGDPYLVRREDMLKLFPFFRIGGE